MHDRVCQQHRAMSFATLATLERISRAHNRMAYKPAARAHDWCVFDFTSRFMNAFVFSWLECFYLPA
jgi:hypothetical protein